MDEQEETFINSLDEAMAFMKGQAVDGVRVHPSRDVPDLKAPRASLAMSQDVVARNFGIPLATLRGWKIGRHMPDRTAVAYLRVIAQIPGPVQAALTGSEPSAEQS